MINRKSGYNPSQDSHSNPLPVMVTYPGGEHVAQAEPNYWDFFPGVFFFLPGVRRNSSVFVCLFLVWGCKVVTPLLLESISPTV